MFEYCNAILKNYIGKISPTVSTMGFKNYYYPKFINYFETILQFIHSIISPIKPLLFTIRG